MNINGMPLSINTETYFLQFMVETQLCKVV